MQVFRVLFALALCLVLPTAAAAEGRVALLPLDAPGKLAIYGQPVAAEVARALSSAGLDVVVIGARMAVPQDAELVIEGKLAQARKRVTVELRLRTMDSRAAIATASASQPSLELLDRAAVAAARELLPQLQQELERRAHPPAPIEPSPDPLEAAAPPAAPADAAPPPALIAVMAPGALAQDRLTFAARLIEASGELAGRRWRPRAIELPEISQAAMLGAIAPSPGALGIAVDVRELAIEQRAVFVGAVQARAIVTFAGKVVFDRTLVSDSIVGGRKATREAMLGLMARELVAILRPRFATAVRALPATTMHAER